MDQISYWFLQCGVFFPLFENTLEFSKNVLQLSYVVHNSIENVSYIELYITK